ncbi:MAG: cytidine deaminase [Beijerinckiaceae bacterium]
MSADINALFDAALAAQARAYAPYSNFHVGAAILTTDGQIFSGCNVENAAYPVGTCAEAGAIAAMIAGGAATISAIAIVGTDARPCYPCGACRQRILEFSRKDTEIHVAGAQGLNRKQHALHELLPFSFTPDMLP